MQSSVFMLLNNREKRTDLFLEKIWYEIEINLNVFCVIFFAVQNDGFVE